MSLEYFDVMVIIPLEAELEAFFEIFPSVENRSTTKDLRHIVNSGNDKIKMIVAQQEQMGRTCAISTCSDLLNIYDVGLIICLGIAGGISDDICLGDVCYSGSIIDIYDNSKMVDGDAGKIDPQFSPTHFKTERELTSAFNFIRTQPDEKPAYAEWRKEREEVAKQIVPSTVVGRAGENENIGSPKSIDGAIICGAVSKSEQYNRKLQNIERKVIAIDTESGGIFVSAQTKNIPAITIRGVSDYANRTKGELEKTSAGSVRKLAASNAASFLKLQLSNRYFLNWLLSRKHGRQTALLPESVGIEPNILSTIIHDLGATIDDNLRKLSPEIKLLPKGYRLPLPRIRRVITEGGDVSQIQSNPLDVRDVLSTEDRVLINLPKTHPDKVLAWIIADNLVTFEANQKQIIPIVIDANAIRGDRIGFDSASPISLEKIKTLAAVQILFIIDDIPFQAKHRLKFILNQIEQFSDSKFIFIARGKINIVMESEFIINTASSFYQICEISFSEIAHFIQKNYEMTGSEAEVVALRLRDTFSRFDLDAHPTYFAEIPREALVTLLQANRRSELIQLAVDGFLTFLVADDREDVALSRTTRSRFLREVVVEMNVEKTVFDQEKLIKFTKEFAEKSDFDINPIEFIRSFEEKGVIHFDQNILQISLPFIESYLLAAELARNPQKAELYFQFDVEDFDTAAFDLYAEIGASDAIVKRVIANVDNLLLSGEPDHILLSDKITPSHIKHTDRGNALRARLEKAVQDVQSGKDESREKQRLIDLSEAVKAAAAKQERSKKAGTGDVRDRPEVKALNLAAHRWVVATVLLGSGAEHLDATVKRDLSGKIVRLASRIIDDWTRLQLSIDFKALKEELTNDEALIREFPNGDVAETKRIVSGFVDLMEFNFLASPLRRVIGFLCEHARQRVLGLSVDNSNVNGIIENIIRGTWLADIDSKRGKSILRDSIRELPAAPFTRITLAGHYLARAYWSHWQKDDRLILLGFAEELIKPLSLKINKPEIKRLIKAKNSKNDDSE